jgi:hypothetical protein
VSLSVNVFAIGHGDHEHRERVVLDGVDDSIVTDTKAIKPVVIALEKLHTTWTRVPLKGVNAPRNEDLKLLRQFGELLSSSGPQNNRIHDGLESKSLLNLGPRNRGLGVAAMLRQLLSRQSNVLFVLEAFQTLYILERDNRGDVLAFARYNNPLLPIGHAVHRVCKVLSQCMNGNLIARYFHMYKMYQKYRTTNNRYFSGRY